MTHRWSLQRKFSVLALLFAVALKPVIIPALLRANVAVADESIGSIPLLDIDDIRLRFEGKSALVIGGTRGVGYGTAHALARAGASVTVVGRSEASGMAAIGRIEEAVASDAEQLGKAKRQEQRLEFFRGDIGTVRSSLSLVESLASSLRKYDILVVTAATFPDWSKPLLNEDGIGKSFAIAVVGRYLVYRNMHKFLNMDTSPPPLVLNVLVGGDKPLANLDRSLASGQRNATNLLDDIACWAVANEIMLIGLEQREASARRTTRISIHPGMLKTDLHRGQGLLFDILEHVLVALAGTSEEDCGMRMASTLASDRLEVGGLSYVDLFGVGRVQSPELKKQVDEHLDWLWDFLLDLESKTSAS